MQQPRILATSIVTFCCLLSFAPLCSGQSTCDWGRVRKLSPGQTITIETASQQRRSGRLVTSSSTDVTLSLGGVTEKLTRDEIVEVSARKTTTWKTGVGLVVAGLGMMVVSAANRPAEAGPGPAWLAGTPIFIVGSLVARSERSRQGLIYRRQ